MTRDPWAVQHLHHDHRSILLVALLLALFLILLMPSAAGAFNFTP